MKTIFIFIKKLLVKITAACRDEIQVPVINQKSNIKMHN